MDDCPICFATKAALLPSATPTSGEWTYVDPALVIPLFFPVDMDQTVEPLPAQFIIDVDGAPKTPDALGWTDATTMTLTYNEAVLGPSVISLEYPDLLPNFVSLQGQPVFPFDLLITPA